MIGMMEGSASMLAYEHLPEGQATVGFEVCVKHVAAAAEGAICRTRATLREVVEGRKLRFDVEVTEGERTIGVGTHERRVVGSGQPTPKATVPRGANRRICRLYDPMGSSTRQKLGRTSGACRDAARGGGARQLLERGLSAQAMQHRIEKGRLHRVERGVYAVGRPELSRRGRWMAAVLGCGSGAALSYGSAAALWGIERERRGAIEVSIPVSTAAAAWQGARLSAP